MLFTYLLNVNRTSTVKNRSSHVLFLVQHRTCHLNLFHHSAHCCFTLHCWHRVYFVKFWWHFSYLYIFSYDAQVPKVLQINTLCATVLYLKATGQVHIFLCSGTWYVYHSVYVGPAVSGGRKKKLLYFPYRMHFPVCMELTKSAIFI